MLSISAKSGYSDTLAADAAAAAEYLDGENIKEKDDYYGKEEGFSHWGGSTAAMAALGIDPASEPDIDTRMALMMGVNPGTGEQAVQVRNKRKMGWDLTFSAPKSVSVVWGATGNTELKTAIQKAHDQAVKKAMQQALELLYSRTGKDGLGPKKQIEAVYSSHQHGTSRELDPQLHTHNFLYNIGLTEDGKIKGLNAEEIFDNKMYLGALYRAELASQMRHMGFEIEEDGDSFKLTDVSDELCKKFSTRRNEIIKACAERGAFDAVTKSQVTLANRKKKIDGINADQLRPEWKAVARELGFKDFDFRDPLESKEYDRKVLFQRLTIGNSTFTEKDIKRELAVYAQHCGKGADFIRSELKTIMTNPNLVKLREADSSVKPAVEALYSTQEMIDLERNMIDTARRLRSAKGRDTRFKKELAEFEKRKRIEEGLDEFKLSGEQVSAVQEMCRGGQLSVIRGVAGAGKTTAAEVAYYAWKAENRNIIGLAIAAKASRGLSDASDEQSTIARFLLEIEYGKRELSKGDVLLVDEAGMIGSRTTKMLLDKVEAAGAKIVLIGDEKQVQAIEAGGSFQAIQKYAARDYAEIKEIRRQKDKKQLEAVYALEAGQVEKGLKTFEEAGCVEIHTEPQSAADAAAAAYFEYRKESAETQVIVTAANHADVNLINERIREELGLKGMGHTVATEFGTAEFAMGDRIIFRKNEKGKGKGQAKPKADQVLTNGDLGTIEAVEETPDGPIFKVRRDIDKELITVDPKEYGHFKHGYAMTVHASQGVTVDRAVGVVNANSSLASREILYVQASRHKKDFKLIGYADIDPQKVEEALKAEAEEKAKAKADNQDENKDDPDQDDKPDPEKDKADFDRMEKRLIREQLVSRYDRSSAKNTTLDFTLKGDDVAAPQRTKSKQKQMEKEA